MTESPPMQRLSASIVTYHSPLKELSRLLESLCAAAEQARAGRHPEISLAIHLIDNAEVPTLDVRELGLDVKRLNVAEVSLTLHQGYGNVGYGKAHNRVLPKLDSDYHLILNSDVEVAPDSLENALDFLNGHEEVILLSPAATDFYGNKQHLCKAYPSLFIFWLRAFAPPFMRRQFAKRMAAYERRDLDSRPSLGQLAAAKTDNSAAEVSIVSGCCMLCKTAALKEVGGFDPGFFLYFEDFDLSLRLGGLGKVMYLTTMRIRHAGGQAARKGRDHQRYFVRSASRFFNKHGWKLF